MTLRGNQGFKYKVKYIAHEGVGFSINIMTLSKVLIKTFFPTPGVEPGPAGWKPAILAVRPRGIDNKYPVVMIMISRY